MGSEAWLDQDTVGAMYALACLAPDEVRALSPAARVRLARMRPDLMLRPEQVVPAWVWRICGFDGGRGFGKSKGISTWINQRVLAGHEKLIGCMAPTEDRVLEVQFAPLIENAPPDNTPEIVKGDLVWPNGVRALAFSPEAPERARGDNYTMCWLSEIVDWNPHTRKAAFDAITTATRLGEARVLWDSTNKGRNDVLAILRELHFEDPVKYPIVGGTMFDNPLLGPLYLEGECRKYQGVRKEEEVYGKHFDQSAGALWQQAWIDAGRVDAAPPLEFTCTTIDPATSLHESADETGIMHGGRSRRDGHAYIIEDMSGRHAPETWADLALKHHHNGGRIGIETKRVQALAVAVLRARATTLGIRIEVIAPTAPWPPILPKVVHVREYSPQNSKETRAEGPAVETKEGRVHHVGFFADLETQQTTWVPDAGMRSPNRLDAAAYLIAELRDLPRDAPPDGSAAIRSASAANRSLAMILPGRRRFGR